MWESDRHVIGGIIAHRRNLEWHQLSALEVIHAIGNSIWYGALASVCSSPPGQNGGHNTNNWFRCNFVNEIGQFQVFSLKLIPYFVIGEKSVAGDKPYSTLLT